MVNIWKDRNLGQFKMRKEGEPSSSTALKFLFRRCSMNLNKTRMIMVISHTNNLAQKLLYQPFCFQHVVKMWSIFFPLLPGDGGWRWLTSFSRILTMVHSIFVPAPIPIFIPPDLGTDTALQQPHFPSLLPKHCNIGSLFCFFSSLLSPPPPPSLLELTQYKKKKKVLPIPWD